MEEYTIQDIGEMLSGLDNKIQELETKTGEYDGETGKLYTDIQEISVAIREGLKVNFNIDDVLGAGEYRTANQRLDDQLNTLNELVDKKYDDVSGEINRLRETTQSTVTNTTEIMKMLSDVATTTDTISQNQETYKQEIIDQVKQEAGGLMNALKGEDGLGEELKAYIEEKSSEAAEKYNRDLTAAKEYVISGVLGHITDANKELSAKITNGYNEVIEQISSNTTPDKAVTQMETGHGRDTQSLERVLGAFVNAFGGVSGNAEKPVTGDNTHVISGIDTEFPDDPASERFAYVTAAYGKNTLGAILAADGQPKITEADEAMNLHKKARELNIGDDKTNRVFNHIIPENAQGDTPDTEKQS